MDRTTRVKKPCPECYSECLFCSSFRYVVRKFGCPGDFGFPKCDKHKEKGTSCDTCGDIREVMVEVKVTPLKIVKDKAATR